MEIELRWILILISIVVLALIVFDGWRRIKRQQRNVSPNNFANLSGETDDDLVDELDPLAAQPSSKQIQDEFADDNNDEGEIVRATTAAATTSASRQKEHTLSDRLDEHDVGVKRTSVVIDDKLETMPSSLFVLNILASADKAFSGSQLLPALLSLGMRYGEMSIFHRHEHINGNGTVLFSLASATEPGVFNLNTMESQSFMGLTLFLQVPGPTHPTNALNLMVQTARRLAKTLDGTVYDDSRQILNDNNLERHYYYRLRQILGKS